jgi:nitroimidazol reductase NimA-like FMN-containing flavoprotein (pyridoxamine 5'-phosphate oxidase superfamily)
VEYGGVTVFGRSRVIDDPIEARHGLQLLLDKYFSHLHPGQDYRPITDDELARTAVYRIDIDEWSGKRKAVAEGFPGAFFFAGGQGYK